MYILLLMFFIMLSVVLIGVILMQSGRGQGLAGVFGGGEMQSMLGPRASDFLEKLTWGGVTLFFVLTIVLSLFLSQRKGTIVDKVHVQTPPVTQQTAPISAGQPISGLPDTADEASSTMQLEVTPEQQPVVPVTGEQTIPLPVGETTE
ncbi:MAG: preprotein translocase subunit SecG [Candidatus Auribacterota bacterium]|jgi:preprotein translocase subunit SecG|nr:preprotein translocase subunit SecG [Candidatus Auribacterota bacterium]